MIICTPLWPLEVTQKQAPLGKDVAPPAGAPIKSWGRGPPSSRHSSCQAPAALQAPRTALGAVAGAAKHWWSCHWNAGFRSLEVPEGLGKAEGTQSSPQNFEKSQYMWGGERTSFSPALQIRGGLPAHQVWPAVPVLGCRLWGPLVFESRRRPAGSKGPRRSQEGMPSAGAAERPAPGKRAPREAPAPGLTAARPPGGPPGSGPRRAARGGGAGRTRGGRGGRRPRGFPEAGGGAGSEGAGGGPAGRRHCSSARPVALGRAAEPTWELRAPSRSPHLCERRGEPGPGRAARRG